MSEVLRCFRCSKIPEGYNLSVIFKVYQSGLKAYCALYILADSVKTHNKLLIALLLLSDQLFNYQATILL